MALTFPASPNENDTHTEGSITYKWDGDKWVGLGLTPSDRLVEGSNNLEINSSNNLVWTGGNVGIGNEPLRKLDVIGNSILVRPTNLTTLHSSGNADAVNNSIIIRCPYGENAATVSNAGNRFGIQFTGANNTVDVPSLNFGDDPFKSASIYGVSEDSGAGYSRKVGMAFYTSNFDLAQAEKLRITGAGDVVIGHTAANAKLHVASGTGSEVGNATNPAFQIGGTGNYRFAIHTTNEQAIIANKNGDDGIAFHTKTGKLDGTFGQAVRIDSNGNVLMGGLTTQQTSVDSSILAIQGGDSNIGIIQVHSGGGETSGDLAGIAFSHGADNETARAKCAIASKATGAYGKGHLCFYVDGANDDFQVSDADEKMRISNDGNVTTPEQFQIEVSRSNDQTGYNSSANFGTPMIFDNVVSSRGTTTGALDTSTGKVTVPVSGVYFLEASAFTSSGDVWQQAWFTQGNNRMQYSDWTTNNQAGANKIQVCGMHYLPADTEVGFHPYGNSTNVTINDSVNHTWFRVTLIS